MLKSENTPPLLAFVLAVEGETPLTGERGLFFPTLTDNSSLPALPLAAIAVAVAMPSSPSSGFVADPPVERGSSIVFFSPTSNLLLPLLNIPANVDPTLRDFLSELIAPNSSDKFSFVSSVFVTARALTVSALVTLP